MLVCRVKSGEGVHLAVQIDNQVYDVPRCLRGRYDAIPATATDLLLDRTALSMIVSDPVEDARLIDYEFLCPVEQPGKIFALAANYADHAVEVGEEPRSAQQGVPHVFPKIPSTLTGPFSPVLIPAVTDMVDYEVELAVIIGRTADRVAPEAVMNHVAGFMVFNDVSGRRMTFQERPEMPLDDGFWDFLYGKWCNGFAIAGPYAVPVYAMPDVEARTMSLSVNGQVRQSARVGDYIFGINSALSFLSRICELHPGDVVTMGTPSGIGEMGLGCLKPGDIVEASIEGLGQQRNVVRLADLVEPA